MNNATMMLKWSSFPVTWHQHWVALRYANSANFSSLPWFVWKIRLQCRFSFTYTLHYLDCTSQQLRDHSGLLRQRGAVWHYFVNHQQRRGFLCKNISLYFTTPSEAFCCCKESGGVWGWGGPSVPCVISLCLKSQFGAESVFCFKI